MRASILSTLSLLAVLAADGGVRGQGAAKTTATVVKTDTVRVDTVATVTDTVIIATGGMIGPGLGGGLPSNVQVAVVGKVAEVEPDVVEVAPYRGAPKDRMVKYKVANLKVEDRVLGASGVTRIRVGFPADAADAGAAGGLGRMTVAVTATVGYMPSAPAINLKAGTDGCFLLAKHPTADFYVLTAPLKRPTDPGYAKEVERLKKTALAMNDPVAALKAKDLDDRFEAARIILSGYQMPRGSTLREAVPEEETRLIVGLLKELPWNPADGKRVRPDGRVVPHRSLLWYAINPGELGFKRPEVPKRKPGEPLPDFEKLMDEATTQFLKENGDKITLKRFVQK